MFPALRQLVEASQVGIMDTMRAYCLSIHADYQCRRSGACCSAPWSIELEAEQTYALRTRGILNRYVPTPAAGGVSVVAKTGSGACVFFDTDGLCAIHRDDGVDLMPNACRNFPRLTLRDPRGVFVTLSHFCPTAAGLLLERRPIAVIDAPAHISLDNRVEGLDATSVLPPLLRPGMLMDFDGYGSWEREALAVLDVPAYTARQSLAVIRTATETTSQWTPGDETLAAHVRAAFAGARSAHAAAQSNDAERPFEAALRRFLAAHLFASWAPYQPGGSLLHVVDRVELALSLAGERHPTREAFIAAVRETDLRLRHT